MTFAPKMPEFYVIIARKIFFSRILGGGARAPSAPVSYAYGVVGYLIIALLQIFRRMYQWKNFENRSIFVKVTANDKVGRFLRHRVY